METIYSGAIVMRTQHFNEITPKNSVFIVEYLIPSQNVTMIKLKGIPNTEFCSDNFTLLKHNKRNLNRAYNYLINVRKNEIKNLKQELKRLTKPDSKNDLFTKKELKKSGIIV